ncbi:MAG: hypothetical protein DDT37_01007 [Firmicutes bacterium]|nr:hypothetical protein [candidate division NPL-UPA2 bacterium]
MKKTWSLFLQDIRLSLQGLYFYMEIIIAVVFVAVMLFVVPDSFSRTETRHVYLELPAPLRSVVVGELEASGATIVLANSLAELEQSMQKDRMSSGLVVSQDGAWLRLEVVLQGHESEQTRALLQATVEGAMLEGVPGLTGRTVTTVLVPNAPRLSDRDSLIPVYLTINVALMGLFIIAAYIFLDKEEGVIRALAVSPLSTGQYLVSKMLLMLFMGLVNSVVVVALLRGGLANYPWLIALVVASNLFGSALGLLIASYFNSMVQAMEVLYTAMIVLMFASYSYLMPSFSPWWVRILPTYSMLFAFREVLFENGNVNLMLIAIVQLAVLGMLAFALAHARYKRTITV